jgi:hypothetical protein
MIDRAGRVGVRLADFQRAFVMQKAIQNMRGLARIGGDDFGVKRRESFVTSVAFSPDGARVLTGSADKTAHLWDAVTGAHGHRGGGAGIQNKDRGWGEGGRVTPWIMRATFRRRTRCRRWHGLCLG